jgi:hypothetical protein
VIDLTAATEVSNMTKCPFCHFDNEEGALFCEQCKSDLGGVPISAAAPAAVAMAEPVMEVEAVVAEAVVAEAVPVEAIPMATTVDAIPVAVEPMPVEAALEVVAPPPAPPPPAPVADAPAAAAAPAPAAAAAPAGPAPLPPGAQPKLLVLRGQKRNVEYPIYDGLNFIGRADEKPVDIDLEDQEPPDRVWCSRQHACISFEGNQLSIEDLNSANGTFINRAKLYPGQKRLLGVNDIIQIGNVQMKVIV